MYQSVPEYSTAQYVYSYRGMQYGMQLSVVCSMVCSMVCSTVCSMGSLYIIMLYTYCISIIKKGYSLWLPLSNSTKAVH